MNGVGEVLSGIVPTRKSKPDPSGLSKVWHDCFKPDWREGRMSGNKMLDQDTVTQMAGSHTRTFPMNEDSCLESCSVERRDPS